MMRGIYFFILLVQKWAGDWLQCGAEGGHLFSFQTIHHGDIEQIEVDSSAVVWAIAEFLRFEMAR